MVQIGPANSKFIPSGLGICAVGACLLLVVLFHCFLLFRLLCPDENTHVLWFIFVHFPFFVPSYKAGTPFFLFLLFLFLSILSLFVFCFPLL